MRLHFYKYHREKPLISVICGDMKLTKPSYFVCPLCGNVAFELYFNVKTHYWGEKDLDDYVKVNRVQCKDKGCKAMFTTFVKNGVKN